VVFHHSLEVMRLALLRIFFGWLSDVVFLSVLVK